MQISQNYSGIMQINIFLDIKTGCGFVGLDLKGGMK
jgi:hypothetical protein